MRLAKLLLLSLVLMGVAGLLPIGCGNEEGTATPPEEEGLTEEEISTATSIADALTAIFQIGNIITGIVHQSAGLSKSPPMAPAPGIAAATCPSITVESVALGVLELSADYGSGCTTYAGYEASGGLGISYHGSIDTDATIEVAFDSFTYEGLAVDGSLSATGRGETWTYTFDGSVGSASEVYQIAMTYTVTIDLAGTPEDPADDTTTISGGGQFTTPDAKTYLIGIPEPLFFESTCSYPTDGTLTYQLQSELPMPVTSIDFGTSGCCAATVSVGSKSEAVDLCVEG